MRKSAFSRILLFLSLPVVFLQACKDDSYLVAPPPVTDQSFVEEFDTLQNAYNRGWRFINRSADIGVTNWEQGSISGSIFAYSSKGTNLGCISSDYQATAGAAETISNWAVSPSIIMQNGDKIIFYTRCLLYPVPNSGGDETDYANRLQVRLNPVNDGLNVGNAEDPGDFTKTLLDINPFYLEYHSLAPDPNAYPPDWTRFEATVFGLNKPEKGRFAFRYFVEGAGSNGRGSEIAIDSVAYVSVNH
jgi:hypothetical protein